MEKHLRLVVATLAVLGAATPAWAEENPWMVRVRAVQLDWKNDQSGAVQSLNIRADKRVIPEVDITYFFSKNLAAELVLTYPQKVDIEAGSANIGSVKALPPSLLLQYHFADQGALKPYVGAGVNYTSFSKRNNLLGGAASVEKSSVGYVVQAGFDYMFDRHWGVNVDLKYAEIKTDVMVGGTAVGELDLSPTMLGIGLTYKY